MFFLNCSVSKTLCRDHGLSATPDVPGVQVLIEAALEAFGSGRDDIESLVELKKDCRASKYKLEASVKASESKLYNFQRSVK